MRKPRIALRRALVLGTLAALVVICGGGCPKVQNGVVDAVQAASSSAVYTNSTGDPLNTLELGIANALIGAFLDHFRVQIGN